MKSKIWKYTAFVVFGLFGLSGCLYCLTKQTAGDLITGDRTAFCEYSSSGRPDVSGKVSSESLDSEETGPAVKKNAGKMQSRLAITYMDPSARQSRHGRYINECLTFLAGRFGEPVYHGRVTLYVISDPLENGSMKWGTNKRTGRKIELNESSLLPTELGTLVHELFHAFYQTNGFLTNGPDFLVEGLAMYAAHEFKYRHMSTIQQQNKLESEAGILDRYYRGNCYDLNRSFSMFGDRERELMYLLSALFIYQQGHANLQHTVTRVLMEGNKLEKRYSQKELGERMNLRFENTIFANTGCSDKFTILKADILKKPVNLDNDIFVTSIVPLSSFEEAEIVSHKLTPESVTRF